MVRKRTRPPSSDERYHDLVSNLPVGVYRTSPDGKIIEANGAMAEMLGFASPEALRAVNARDLYVEPKDRTASLERLRTTGTFFVEFQLKRHDGRTIWVRDFQHAVLGARGQIEYLDGVLVDVTDRKRAEEALRAARDDLEARVAARTDQLAKVNESLRREISQHDLAEAARRESDERFRAFAENARDVIMRFDREKRHLYVNPPVEAETGIKPADFIGRTHRELGFPEELCERLENAIESVFTTGRVQRIEFELPSHIWIDWQLVPELAEDGRVAYVLTAARDITVRKRAEVELEKRVAERTAELAAANEALQAEIAQRKRAAKELQESEERFRRLSEAAHEGIAISDGGILVDVNSRFAQMFGYEVGELLGKDVRELVAPELREIVRGHMLSSYEPMYESAGLRKDGTTFPVEVHARSLPFGEHTLRITAIRDITDRKRAEETRLRLATAVEQAAETIVITDPKGAILYVNPAFERTTGYSAAEALGQNPRILKSGAHDDAFYREMWNVLAAGGVWSGRIINRRKDGTRFEEEATISPVRDAGGAIVNYVAVKRDVTQEVHLAEQLRESQKLRAIGQLAGGVAHDFNNLLQALLGTVEVLRKSGHDPEVLPRAITELEADVKRGAALTRQLLLFAHRGVVKPELLDLNDIVRAAESLLRRLVREDIRFATTIVAEPLPIVADRGQLEQVLINLAVNATDAMPDGGDVIIRTRRFGDDEAILEFEDTGVGIPEELQPRIFEPFFTTKGAERGIGLGLSVVHGIVTQHGGRIEVKSRVGNGCAFLIAIPLHRADLPRPVPERVPLASVPPRSRGERVLLVEDEPGAREGLRQILTMLGYEVTPAATAEEGARFSEEERFDLLLTDLLLPGMHGGELARSLREKWPDLRVIVMSGHTEDEAVRRGVREGALRFLQKPFDMTTLARELRAAFDEPA